MSDGAPSEKPDRPPLPRDAFRAQRVGTPPGQRPPLQPVVVTPAYHDPVTPAPPAQRRLSSETGEPDQPKKAPRSPRDRNRNPFEAYGERASSRPYALRLPDAIDLALRQLAAEERTQPLRIVDRAIHDLLKRLGRLPPVDGQ
ncbi:MULTISPECIES: hypothetical protein [Hyphomicrobiales]|uniref:Uncharacterized protein n=1 Tax=Ancylobacter polymorphus TaxID=223390 RepID=A0A9E7CXF0_9HYPH|nr:MULTISPECIES: hypothetical protein [Hyphomicrobiales]CAH1662730.1 conserved hypothetical protein [Hyphomicrobiales bacterium]ETR79454.1 hypothetical protein X566_00620 [Afipia sp. P52-10]MBS7743624.1 hypothetical protein [Chelatococcus sp. HY11]MBX3546473.1 hypothetical protein [Chelatococcus sp.]MCO5079689.1 hypothetical protein [Chelatococcus sp.]